MLDNEVIQYANYLDYLIRNKYKLQNAVIYFYELWYYDLYIPSKIWTDDILTDEQKEYKRFLERMLAKYEYENMIEEKEEAYNYSKKYDYICKRHNRLNCFQCMYIQDPIMEEI